MCSSVQIFEYLIFQVSSSVSERLHQGEKGEGGAEASWDINDPDIPARIDQHVSETFV